MTDIFDPEPKELAKPLDDIELPKESLKCKKPHHFHGFFGLYIRETQVAIPLKQVFTKAKITNGVARVTQTQKYYNESEKMLETEYFFPIATNACYDGFRAKFGDTVIEGKIKEKEEAKK